MAHQSLDHNEILNVRWATQDPNPLAQKRDARRIEEQAAEAVRRALPAEFVAEIEGRDPNSVKRKRLEGSYASHALDGPESQGAIESTKQAALLEAPRNGAEHTAVEAEIELVEVGDSEDIAQENGILSNSILAALKGHSVRQGGSEATGKAKQGLTGSLVGYDSDEDSD